MFGYLAEPAWSPYVAGAGIGILVCFSLVLSDRPLGCSTGYAKACGLIDRTFPGISQNTRAFYEKVVPAFDGQFMIVPGIAIGSFISAMLSGTFALAIVPPLWAASFGSSPVVRICAAFIGGVLLAAGARWAGGCTSGHGISGTLQLGTASVVAATCFFAGGILAAFFLFRVIGG